MGDDDTKTRVPGAYEGFAGTVGRTFTDPESQPSWREHVKAPEGAPNIVIVMADDLGFADLGCYGSEIATPHLDRLAAEGVRFTNFHVAPMCSPTRAALLTGVHPHRAGMGFVANADPGFPGYASELADDVTTMAEVLRDNGYATLMSGKWHLTRDIAQHEAADKSSWPCQRGFDRFYGILDAFTNFHQPHRLFRDNSVVEVDRYPDGYYFTDDITDEAIAMIRSSKAADPSKPFFCYLAHGAVHAPLQAKPEDIERYRGAYDAGWDEIRAQRYARQRDLGVIPDGVELAPRNSEEGYDARPWDELSDMEKELFARYMEVYAGMVDNVDQCFGRLRAALDELGELDNTLIVFTSDNGGSKEGMDRGTTQYFRTLMEWVLDLGNGGVREDYERLDKIGGPETLPHYPRGWAMVSNTPFRLYKLMAHAGAHSVPMIFWWPKLAERGVIRRQYAHCIDTLATVAELVGFDLPTERHGRPLAPMAGRSFADMLERDDAAERTQAYYEADGHRAYYRDGWEIVALHRPGTPISDSEYELFHTAEDPSQVNDLAPSQPEKVAELAAEFDAFMWEQQVYPLDEGSRLKVILRDPYEQELMQPLTIVPGTPTLDRTRSALLTSQRGFTVTARLDGYAEGDAGVLVAHGDQGGGYSLEVDGGVLRFVHNGLGLMTRLEWGTLPSDAGEVVLRITAPGQFTWDAALTVDGKGEVAATGLRMLMGISPFEGITVGRDPRSPVDWQRYTRHGSHPYSGRLASVTYEPGEWAPEAGVNWIPMLREMGPMYE